jgi:hypothetical protein
MIMDTSAHQAAWIRIASEASERSEMSANDINVIGSTSCEVSEQSNMIAEDFNVIINYAAYLRRKIGWASTLRTRIRSGIKCVDMFCHTFINSIQANDHKVSQQIEVTLSPNDAILETSVAFDNDIHTRVSYLNLETPLSTSRGDSSSDDGVHNVVSHTMDKVPVTVKDSRKIRSGTHICQSVVAFAKNKLGVPERNQANLLVARRVCLNYMQTSGLRPTHIHQLLPKCVEMVFIPSDSEMEARALGGCYSAVQRRNYRKQSRLGGAIFSAKQWLWGRQAHNPLPAQRA